MVDRLDEVPTQIILKFYFQHNGDKLFNNNNDDGDAMTMMATLTIGYLIVS